MIYRLKTRKKIRIKRASISGRAVELKDIQMENFIKEVQINTHNKKSFIKHQKNFFRGLIK